MSATNVRPIAAVVFLSLIGFHVGSGCASWTPWPFGPARTAHESKPPPDPPPDRSFFQQARTATAAPVRVVDIAFDVMRVELSLSGVRDSQKIWNHVDEARMNPDQSTLLARNGFRVGVTSPDSWPAIQTVLAAAGARISSETVFPQRGAPLPVTLGRIQDDESIFVYGRDGRLAGKTFSAGDRVILIDYAVRPELDGCVDIGLSFEIVHDTGQTVWERRDGVLQQVPGVERHRFDDLTSLLTLHPGEFLIAGLRDDIRNEYVIGGRFLSGRRSGERFEVLLFIAPRPYQSQSARREP